MSKRIRVAVVGVNNIGSIHCRSYKEHDNVDLVAVCDLRRDRAVEAGNRFGTAVYTDIETMLTSEKIDIVSVATAGEENGSHHYGPVKAAIKAGKDVLVEKPISNNIDEARQMVRLANDKGVRLACNMNHRFVPMAEKARQLIDGGKLGTLLFINMRLTIRNGLETTPWVHLRALHPHSFDVIRYFAGDVRRVQAFMTKAPGRQTWSTASINLEFHNGAVGHLTGSYDMSMKHPIEHCEVAGSNGRLELENIYEQLAYYPHDSEEKIVFRNSIMNGTNGFQETFRNRIHTFIEEVQQQVSPQKLSGSGVDALAAQEIIEAAIQSHQQNGAVVEVPAISANGM